jgi:integrase
MSGGECAAIVRVICCLCLARKTNQGTRPAQLGQWTPEGVDIGIISKQLGHRSISTTAHYLDHIAPHSVLMAIQKRDWKSAGTTRC